MPRILHLGLGNFHRAHQAWYTAHSGGDWEITGVSLRSSAIRDALQPQGGAYTLATKDADGMRYERLEVIDRVLVAPENPDSVIAEIATADLVTVTVTEKGYHLEGGHLDLMSDAVQRDLAGPPATIYGLLAHGLRRRDRPLTVLSCDNLAANGPTLQAAVFDFLDAFDPTLRTWAEQQLNFPATMVDRITPATTGTLKEEVRLAGLACSAPVETESFSDWVIEEFPGPKPDWSSVGAQFVDDVAPYELRKLRLLNGAHSYLAYAGTLAGHDFVHQAINDPKLRKTAQNLMRDATEVLPDETRRDADDYAQALIRRFENPNLNHRLRQIAMDGTQKLPQRLLGTWNDRRARGLESPAIKAALSAWVRFAKSETQHGRVLDDPHADAIAAACRSGDAAKLLSLIDAPTDLVTSLNLSE